MKKFRIEPSFLLLVFLSICFNQTSILINYLFALILHELAHLYIATKRGYNLKQIKIDLFGMAVELDESIDDSDTFAINIAGPCLNLFLCIICMALYWLIPTSFNYLNNFCIANLVLALFNLLPVYPLDGGKIFSGIVKNKKAYRILDCIVRYAFASVFICAFLFSCATIPNYMLLLIAFFFIISKGKNRSALSIFKYRHNKNFDKVVIIKVKETENLFNIIKQINQQHYTIFYVAERDIYYNEDKIIEKAVEFPLTTTLKELN